MQDAEYGIEVIHVSGTASIERADVLAEWLRATPARPRVRGHQPASMVGRLRFAFYGRISTREYQDPASSQAWQLDSATQTIAGQGQIIATYFDGGCSRRLPWTQRPEPPPYSPPSPAPPGTSTRLSSVSTNVPSTVANSPT